MGDELFIQNISLDKVTLRILLNIVDYTKFLKFKFYECRLTKNGINLLSSNLAKIDKPGLTIEISFNPIHDQKDFAIIIKDCFTNIILRCNHLDQKFASAASDSLKLL